MSFASPGFNAHRGFNLLFGDVGATGPKDPFFSDVIALLPFDSANGSTVFLDKSPLALPYTQIEPALLLTSSNAVATPFGPGTAAAALGDGSLNNCGVRSPAAVGMNYTPANTPFVFEGWFFSPSWGLIGDFGLTDFRWINAGNLLHLLIHGVVGLRVSVSGTVNLYGDGPLPSTGVWHYFAFSFDGTTGRLYLGNAGGATAVLVQTGPFGELISAAGNNFFTAGCTGGTGNPPSGLYYSNYRVTFRQTRGYLGATIPVPTAAFPTS